MSQNLTDAMQVAIPLWIAKLEKLPLEEIHRKMAEKAVILPDLLAGNGELLLVGGGKDGEVTKLFNQTAEAVALLSFLYGGVNVFGHWETIHPDEREKTDALC